MFRNVGEKLKLGYLAGVVICFFLPGHILEGPLFEIKWFSSNAVGQRQPRQGRAERGHQEFYTECMSTGQHRPKSSEALHMIPKTIT